MIIKNENDALNIKVIELKETKNIIHKVAYQETVESIAKLYNQTKEVLIKFNNLTKPLEEGERIVIPQKNKAIYVVQPLDTLSKIANKYKVSEEEIKNLNKIEKIFIGQVLII